MKLTAMLVLNFENSTETTLLARYNRYNYVTRAAWYLKSSEIRLCVQQLVRANNKRNINVLYYWPFVREIHRSLFVPLAKDQQCGKIPPCDDVTMCKLVWNRSVMLPHAWGTAGWIRYNCMPPSTPWDNNAVIRQHRPKNLNNNSSRLNSYSNY